MPEKFDTLNRFAVTALPGRGVGCLHPPVGPLTRAEALNLTAWIVAIAGFNDDELLEAIRAVEKT